MIQVNIQGNHETSTNIKDWSAGAKSCQVYIYRAITQPLQKRIGILEPRAARYAYTVACIDIS